jgi:hypothetical protein
LVKHGLFDHLVRPQQERLRQLPVSLATAFCGEALVARCMSALSDPLQF